MRVGTILLLGSLASSTAATSAHAQDSGSTFDVQKAIALRPYTCVTAHPGEWVTFDWNPGFQDAGLMHGIGLRTLHLSPLRDNSQIAGPVRVELGGLRGGGSRAEDLGNGFFRFQFALPRQIRRGDLLVTGATIRPRMIDEDATPMEMTHDPREEHFCITVVSALPPTAVTARTP